MKLDKFAIKKNILKDRKIIKIEFIILIKNSQKYAILFLVHFISYDDCSNVLVTNLSISRNVYKRGDIPENICSGCTAISGKTVEIYLNNLLGRYEQAF